MVLTDIVQNIPVSRLKWAILKCPFCLADSAESVIFFSGISHFLVHYVNKIKGTGNWIPDSATGPLLSARGIGHFKILTFSHLSGMNNFSPIFALNSSSSFKERYLKCGWWLPGWSMMLFFVHDYLASCAIYIYLALFDTSSQGIMHKKTSSSSMQCKTGF